MDDNPSLELVKFEAENDTLQHVSITCWDEPAPNFAALLRPLSDLMAEDEYLYFEEKVKFGHRGRTLRALLISGVGVFKAEQDALVFLLQERNGELDKLDNEEDNENDDELDDDAGIDPLEDPDQEHGLEPDDEL